MMLDLYLWYLMLILGCGPIIAWRLLSIFREWKDA